jgi:TRAP-type C4-dicarboxylate transport system permease small subunit
VALFTGALIALYAAVVAIWGTRLAFIGSLQTSPALQLDMGWVYLVFPLAGGLMLLEAALALRGPRPPTGPEAP